jgi:redox-sensing transcriptional repressor
MSVGDAIHPAAADSGDAGPMPERLSLGVAARLSRYLQVLTQAKKMGKETISSQELSDYTHVNSTQIRRDLSGFGKFGKRGVGYNVDSRKIGHAIGTMPIRHVRDLKQVVEEEDIVVGVLAVPNAAAQELADHLVDAGVKIIFNYSEALLQVPPEVTVHTSSPAVDLLYALYFYLT